jgi:hypothetical protein
VPGERLEQHYTVKEVTKINIIGVLYLSNYKILFKPNGTKLHECLKYTIPYGYITKINEKTNSDKTDCVLSLTCKDERTFKFKIESNGPMF